MRLRLSDAAMIATLIAYALAASNMTSGVLYWVVGTVLLVATRVLDRTRR